MVSPFSVVIHSFIFTSLALEGNFIHHEKLWKPSQNGDIGIKLSYVYECQFIDDEWRIPTTKHSPPIYYSLVFLNNSTCTLLTLATKKTLMFYPQMNCLEERWWRPHLIMFMCLLQTFRGNKTHKWNILSIKTQLRQSLASHSRGLGSILGQITWDLWWTRWHWGRFPPSTCFPCQFNGAHLNSPLLLAN
jgi:hypothetical protein